MSKKVYRLVCAAAGVVLGLGLMEAKPTFAANLLTNGSFEEGNKAGFNFSWKTVVAGDNSITGWTVGGRAVDWHNSAEFKFPADGQYVVDLNLSGQGISDTGTLSQSFATTIGNVYKLAFSLSGPKPAGYSFPDPRQVRVNIAGLEQIFSTPSSLNSSLVWETKELTFKAVESVTTLKFSSVNGAGFWGPVLDNVSVEKVSTVPEPTSLIGLFAVGALTTFGLTKSQKRKQADI
jgi:choice-of-anchor C domain-containing protein